MEPSPEQISLSKGLRINTVRLKMCNLLLAPICGIFLLTSCKKTGNEVEESEAETVVVNSSNVVFPLYEERVFELEKKYTNSTINNSLIENLKPWDQELLLKLFIPLVGANTVYTYKTKYSIPKNIDETEGDYDEYLIVEVEANGTIVNSLLYEGGPKQGPIFWYLFQGANTGTPIHELGSLAQLNLVCPFSSRGEDLLHNGNGRIK
jgi:hypothetical protein